MSPRPTDVGSFGERLYGQLEPVAKRDEELGWHLLILCGAAGAMFQEIEDYARDTDESVGWSSVVDLERAPDKFLPWLAQLVGVRTTPPLAGETAVAHSARMRDRIALTDGFKRGTRAAMIGAAQQHLTGTKYVLLNERNGSAYQLGVITQLSETPDTAATLRALNASKPAGIILNYTTVSGNSYLAIRAAFNTYTLAHADYADYTAMRANPPTP